MESSPGQFKIEVKKEQGREKAQQSVNQSEGHPCL